MELEFCDIDVGRERRDSMDPALEAMHPLDPPPPDVLLALLARNKALEEANVLYHDLVEDDIEISLFDEFSFETL
ncbi:jg9398 [Pararge aegeria aegeria]|uniref:Jg9398 protein n=1 Tax=Pararge aegeria aegeria TaxID=348720 RepID=A0A8S4RZR3_9NEOP|nr:jg9398 [Pararge aegeria aegeria]